MATSSVSPDEQYRNSPFGVMRSRIRRGKLTKAPRNTGANRRVYDLLLEHLAILCREKRCSFRVEPHKVAQDVFGQPMTPSRAWEALIRSFEMQRSELVDSDEPIRLSIAFARGRLFAMSKQEGADLARAMASDAAQHRSQQYAAERAANGGEIEFYSSGAWQRLRFEVLAEREGCCDLCGRSYREHGVALEVDHIKPRSRFPSLAMVKENLQVLCFDCNRGKGNRDTTDWRATPANDVPQDEVA